MLRRKFFWLPGRLGEGPVLHGQMRNGVVLDWKRVVFWVLLDWRDQELVRLCPPEVTALLGVAPPPSPPLGARWARSVPEEGQSVSEVWLLFPGPFGRVGGFWDLGVSLVEVAMVEPGLLVPQLLLHGFQLCSGFSQVCLK